MRGFWTAVKLGWRNEANWTDPVLFFIYSVAKPISTVMLLVVMLEVIGGSGSRELRGFIVAGSALWSFVTSGITGLAWSVLEDRERFRMLKYLYVSPSAFLVLLLGRGVARIGVGAMGAIITLAFGVVVLGVPFDAARVNWPFLLVVTVAGLAAIVALGILMAAICLQTRQESWSYPEAVAGALYLVSGAIFPLAILPAPAQAIGLLTPLSWWAQGTRAALFPGGVDSIGGPGSLFATLAGHAVPTTIETLGALLLTGAVGTLAAVAVFRASDRRAKEYGLLDQTSGS
jgi:ABC-2 type transport system permease protein